MKRQIVLIAHNVRSAHNVGSLLRTADGLGIEKVCLTGYTPYPQLEDDSRLPHLSAKIGAQIAKVSLGAEKSVAWKHVENLGEVVADLKANGFTVVALEQTPNSLELNKLSLPGRVALIVGNEIEGLSPAEIELADQIVEIPMIGKKESFNVATAAAMALFVMRFY